MLSRIARLAARIGHARARSFLLASGILVGVVLAAATTWFVVELRRNAVSDTMRELRNTALILAEEIDRGFGAAEQVQSGLIERMRGFGIDTPEQLAQFASTAEQHRDLRGRIERLPNLDSLTLVDAHGRVAGTSRQWPVPQVDVSDREYFGILSKQSAIASFIGEPVLNRTTGEWSILLTRRFSSGDNRLLGFVTITMRISYFEQVFARIKLDGEGSFSLYRTDGVLLARYPHVDANIGKQFGDTANFRHMLAAAGGEGIRQVSLQDGRDRLIASQALAHFPLLIAVSDTVAAATAPWRAEAQAFALATLLLELVIGASVLVAVRHLRGYETLQAAEAAQARAEAGLALAEQRESAAHALRTQEQRFNLALHNMLQGLLMFGGTGELLVVNRRFHELFGLADGSLTPGIGYHELTERVVAEGNVSADDMRMVRENRIALIARNERATSTWELSDGRSFNVTHQPMDEGWLTTFENITERRLVEAQMTHLAHHDPLTGLANRVLFRRRLEESLAFARRGYTLALLCLDLDQFKAVNDTLGHPTGDVLLQAVAALLVGSVRETDVVARLGSDEFAIVQNAIERPTEATVLANRLVELLKAPFEIAGHQIIIGTSIGIAFAPQDTMDADQLLRCADMALYRAKLEGRGVYRLFHAEMDAEMQQRRLLELDLRQALQAGQFEPFYQPTIDLRIGAVSGFEALLRWRHPTRGLVPPAEFIPLAEDTGVIVPVGEWVLRAACGAAVTWPGDLRVAVNLSAAQFRSPALLDAVERALRESGLPARRLELEITESIMLHDTDANLTTLHRLHDLGVGIAMDDFGTGYSSLSYLRRFPFDRIKIDQSFVRELSTRRDCSAIVRAVAALGRELGMATTAEGVETREQLDALTRAGCAEAQGFLFSPAVPGSEVIDLLGRLRNLSGSPSGLELAAD